MNNSFLEKYGPWALVTGGTSGIGAEFANQIAEHGVNLILVARTEKSLAAKAEELAKNHSIEVKTIQADLSAPEGPQQVIEQTKGLEIGLWIPCAGIENHGLMTDLDLNKELALLQLNVTSTFALTHHFAGQMVERGKGGILFVASMIGHMPNPYFSNYAGSKAYVLNFGTSLHWEMKKKGVDVTVLSPGYTVTPMTKGLDATFDMSKMPMTPMNPDKVAKVGLEGLGKKPLVIPGKKNKMMVFMTKHFAGVSTGISMGGKMMEKAMVTDKD
jgi:uncharacterized protein